MGFESRSIHFLSSGQECGLISHGQLQVVCNTYNGLCSFHHHDGTGY